MMAFGPATLWNTDCRDLCAFEIPSGSVDVCIADPPYGDTSLDWDRVCHGWIGAVAQVLKPASSFWVFGSLRHLMVQRVFAQMRAHGFRYSQDVVWRKQNGTGFHADRFRRVHEHAVLFYRGAWADVHHEPQYTLDAQKKVVRRKKRPAHTGHIEASHYVSEDGGPRLMTSVLEVRNEHGRAIHPTQKPVELLRPLVRYSVPLNGVCLDPFAGGGSVALACALESRRTVSCEIDPDRYAQAAARLESEILW